MKHFDRALTSVLLVLCLHVTGGEPAPERGRAKAESTRPRTFPHRIWAATDFESQTPDYGWFGPAERANLPKYPGNATSLGTSERPYKKECAVMTGINPVPGPRMGKANQLFLRYLLVGGTEATFQHFSLSKEDNQHIRVCGLEEGKWSELTLNFSRDARRNDGSAEAFGDGERMDDFKIFAGRAEDSAKWNLWIDDVIFFASDPQLPPEPELFPNRVIYLAAFDTGPKEKYWPGDFEIAEKDAPTGTYWRAAKAIPRKDGNGKLVSLPMDPPRPVGEHTKLRFRYHLSGATGMTVQIFDATVQDNRHVRLTGLKENEWATLYVDFSRDARRNDGTADSKFPAGNKVDDIFFFVEGKAAQLFVDEVVLFDAGK